MHFPVTNSTKKFASEYFSRHIKKYLRQKKELIHFPEGCSFQMANLVKDHIEENYLSRAILITKNKRDSSDSYALKVNYSSKE